jgi:hypothetical protein
MRGIAYRRHTVAREKARALRKLKARWNWTPPEGRPTAYVAAQVGILATTRAPCSCYACGNPRRHFGEIPMGERRIMDIFREQLCDLAWVSPEKPLTENMDTTC